MSFQNHFNMLSLHEPVTHKAKFWQSYVRALKGTDDMRADESTYRRPRGRALSEFPDFLGKSILNDYPYSDANSRIHVPGYRYLPISRNTYGYSPRNIYAYDRPRYAPRPSSVPPETPWLSPPSYYETPNHYPIYTPKPWERARSLSRERSPSPSFLREGSPVRSEVGGYNNRPYNDLYNPSPYLPISRVTRDPWWYDAYGLRPVSYIPRSVLTYPSALRNSYLSPIRNYYLWSRHPLRYL